jgi:hypothetical protein
LTPAYASLARRTRDLRILGFSTIRDTFVVKLPKGATVESAPPAAHGENRFGSYSVQVDKKAGRVVVKSHLSIKVSRVKPADYSAWRKFCSQVDQALSPRLVITP